jgi:hypothetical protein
VSTQAGAPPPPPLHPAVQGPLDELRRMRERTLVPGVSPPRSPEEIAKLPDNIKKGFVVK